jgi:hypothetical protein
MTRKVLQIEDYMRTAEEDEHFGIDHLKAHDGEGTGLHEQRHSAKDMAGAADNNAPAEKKARVKQP